MCLLDEIIQSCSYNIYLLFRVLQNSMSSTYEDEGPLPWFRTEMAIYYIVYFVVFPFFFVNIFVALVIVTFNELGEAELTDNIDKNQVKENFKFTNMCIIHFHLEILYYLRCSNQTTRSVCSGDTSWCSISYLETRHLAPLWKFHHVTHYSQHTPFNVQGL